MFVTNALKGYYLYVHTRDGMIQAPSVSMYHVKSITIWQYITA